MSDFSNFRAVYDELTDAVAGARHQFMVEHLQAWFAQIDETPAVAAAVAELQRGLDVNAFLKEAEESQGSFVGSGRLAWLKDPKQRLGMKLLVFRKLANEEVKLLDFSYDYTYVTNSFDANASALSEQIFSPMARDLRRHLERLDAEGKLVEVPASDRVVRLDHNSAHYIQALDALEELEKALKDTNLYEDQETKEQHVAEVSAVRRLLQSTRVRIYAVTTLLTPVVVYVTKKLADSSLSKIAGKVVDVLTPLLGALF